MVHTTGRRHKLNRYEIRAKIMERGGSLTSVARKAGLSESACRMALRGWSCPAGEVAIARFIGMPVRLVFPDRYDRDGNRRANPPKCREEERAA